MIDVGLLLLMVAVAVVFLRVRDLFAAAMLFAIYSLLSAALFAVLDAGDVALTEAAVGAGISTLLILAVLTLTRRHEHVVQGHNLVALLVVLVTGAALIYATLDLPEFGLASNPIHGYPGSYYTAQSYADMGVPNMVAAVLASYRSIDTMGEAFVIFAAGLGVYTLLGRRPQRIKRREPSDDSGGQNG